MQGSPQRQVQSLPRPSTITRLEVSDSPLPVRCVGIPVMPKRSNSFHIKSHSISHTPLSPMRKSSLDIAPAHESMSVFIESPAPSKRLPPQLKSGLTTSAPMLPSLTNSSSSLDQPTDLEKLEIETDEETSFTPDNDIPPKRHLSSIVEQRSSTQSAPGTLQSSPESSPKNRMSTETQCSDLSRASSSSASSYSGRIRRLRGRQARETEGIIKPGKVAAMLHRYSSTNRGSIRSVYYDSDGDEDDHIRKPATSRHSPEIDHLSVMLDETLEDLEASGYDKNFLKFI